MAPCNHSTLSGPSDFLSAFSSTAPPATATSAPGGTPTLSRPLLESRLHSRSCRARRRTRWQTRIEAIVQGLHGVQVLSRHDIEDGNVEEALDAAIEWARLKMMPLSEQELRDPGNKAYSRILLTDDVLLCRAGRLLAVVSAATRGKVVQRMASIATPR
jgi:hypothetical protein